MIKIDSAEGIFFTLAGKVHESLEEDITGDNLYCTVKIESPSLVYALGGFIALYITGALIPDKVEPIAAKFTIPWGRFIESSGLIGALGILASISSYQIEIWAQPLGEIRRSVQATWEDTTHQSEIGTVVSQSLVDQLCYDANDCQVVADIEGMIVTAQRNRVTFTKIAHLQDEEGDTIRIPHPYGGQNMDIFITDIARTYKKAVGSSGGYFLDKITGWVV
jgi:hypothetical protein